MGFSECDQGTSGQELASKITSCLQTYRLDLSNLRGQAYDGAHLHCAYTHSFLRGGERVRAPQVPNTMPLEGVQLEGVQFLSNSLCSNTGSNYIIHYAQTLVQIT